ncbi:MAG: hypothetical protein GY735_23735 [Delftia sp.]|nr:hypothetical protein [Delftia sp.]
MSNTKAEKYSPKWLYDKIAASNNEAKGIFYILEYQRELKKSLTIPVVVKSFTAEEVGDMLATKFETIEDAIHYFDITE